MVSNNLRPSTRPTQKQGHLWFQEMCLSIGTRTSLISIRQLSYSNPTGAHLSVLVVLRRVQLGTRAATEQQQGGESSSCTAIVGHLQRRLDRAPHTETCGRPSRGVVKLTMPQFLRATQIPEHQRKLQKLNFAGRYDAAERMPV